MLKVKRIFHVLFSFYFCVLNSRSKSIDVVAGAFNILESEHSQILRTVETYVIHENFNHFNGYTNDIALLKLKIDVPFSDYIRPISLPKFSDKFNVFVGEEAEAEETQMVTIAGWGMISDREPSISKCLKWAKVNIISQLDCSRWWFGAVTQSHLCSQMTDGRAPCDGDDGGPLIATDEFGMEKQIGIASFGYVAGCASNYPYVYTKLTEFLQWISDNSDVQILP